MRYDATVVDAKEKIDSGTYGAIKAITATNHGTYPGGWFAEKPLSGGGAIIDHSVHVADLVRYFTGDEFGVVRAYQGKNIRQNISVEDNALLYCRMQKSDMPVSIDCSWSRMDGWPTWGDVCMNIVCERGLIRLDCFKPHLNVVSHGKFSWHGLNENLSKKMVAGFCRAVRDGVEPTASFKDGAQAARVAFAAYESLQCGSQPVSLK
jgi:predicted dehydrogenase